MKSLAQKYATPLITGLFLVSLVSGIALFFHIGNATFHGMHEWLSMVLILPFLLHLWRNWRSFVLHLGRVPMTIALVFSLGAGLAFAAIPAGNTGGPPQFAFAHAIAGNSLEKIAPLIGNTADDLEARLRGDGFTVRDPQTSLVDIAAQSGRSEIELFAALRAAAR